MWHLPRGAQLAANASARHSPRQCTAACWFLRVFQGAGPKTDCDEESGAEGMAPGPLTRGYLRGEAGMR
jgi:hypothetical protein